MDKFLRYASNRRDYLAEMFVEYRKAGDTLNMERIKREQAQLERSIEQAEARMTRGARMVA